MNLLLFLVHLCLSSNQCVSWNMWGCQGLPKEKEHTQTQVSYYYDGNHIDMHALYLFTCRLPNGAEYLFVAKDEPEVISWVQTINSVIQGTQPPPPPPPPPPAQLEGVAPFSLTSDPQNPLNVGLAKGELDILLRNSAIVCVTDFTKMHLLIASRAIIAPQSINPLNTGTGLERPKEVMDVPLDTPPPPPLAVPLPREDEPVSVGNEIYL